MPERGSFDRDKLNQILDEALICHVGFVTDDEPFVIPTSFCRTGEEIVLHGSSASRMLRVARSGVPICVCVTLVDGLVLARSAFHQSVNYRSAVIFGRAREVEEREEKVDALHALSEHIVPGRWDEIRKPTDLELKATSVLAIPLNEYSVKIRVGPPKDDEEDYALPIWAGVLPLHMDTGDPVTDERVREETKIPEYVTRYSRTNATRGKRYV